MLVLQEVPEAVRIVSQEEVQNQNIDVGKQVVNTSPVRFIDPQSGKPSNRLLPKSRSAGAVFDGNLTSAEAQQVRTQPLTLSDLEDADVYAKATMELLAKEDPNFMEKNGSIVEYVKNRKKQLNTVTSSGSDEGSTQKKQQILEELHVSFYEQTMTFYHLLTSICILLRFREWIVNFMGSRPIIIFYFLTMEYLKNNALQLPKIHCPHIP